MNSCMFLGNLVADPEKRSLPSGVSVVSFRLAVNDKPYTDKTSGEKVKKTNFLDFEAWSGQGDIIAQYFAKGDPIVVRATAKQDIWDAEDGTKRSKIKFRVEDFYFVGGKKKEESAAPAKTKKAAKKKEEESVPASGDDGEIPF